MRRRSLDACEILRTVLLLATSFCLVNLLFENTAASVHGSPLFQPYTIVATPSVILDNGTVGSRTIYTNNTSAKVRVAAPLEWGSWSDELLSNPSFEVGQPDRMDSNGTSSS